MMKWLKFTDHGDPVALNVATIESFIIDWRWKDHNREYFLIANCVGGKLYGHYEISRGHKETIQDLLRQILEWENSDFSHVVTICPICEETNEA